MGGYRPATVLRGSGRWEAVAPQLAIGIRVARVGRPVQWSGRAPPARHSDVAEVLHRRRARCYRRPCPQLRYPLGRRSPKPSARRSPDSALVVGRLQPPLTVLGGARIRLGDQPAVHGSAACLPVLARGRHGLVIALERDLAAGVRAIPSG